METVLALLENGSFTSDNFVLFALLAVMVVLAMLFYQTIAELADRCAAVLKERSHNRLRKTDEIAWLEYSRKMHEYCVEECRLAAAGIDSGHDFYKSMMDQESFYNYRDEQRANAVR